MIIQVNLISLCAKYSNLLLCTKITSSWWLDLHIRWFIVWMQTLLAVTKVAWVNLPPFTWGHGLALFPPPGCLVFYPAPRCHSLSFLAHMAPACFLQPSWLYKTKASSGGMRPAMEKNKPKSCCVCHLSWQEQDVNFCKGSCSKSLSLKAWQRQRGPQRLHGV